MLGPELGNLDHIIALVYDSLIHTIDFMSKDQCIFRPGFGNEFPEAYRSLGLLYADYFISVSILVPALLP